MASVISLLPIGLFIGISAIITLLLKRKGYFSHFHRTHYVLVALGCISLLLDIIQTQIFLGHGIEGNPVILGALSFLPQDWVWVIFLIHHFVFGGLTLIFGWKGRIMQDTFSRVLVCFLSIFLFSGVIWNIIGMVLLGVL